ncbi:hypothetical protein L2E82_36137 [Cichorium intybus]|uniref:Uncharacterized protein n=1 Tax=Cichorium intybus TaxID=13427 RepID=A0ACB9BQT5_CICIN|nr:hypothetical protein L2E82_36137 [Cichorium intybus]
MMNTGGAKNVGAGEWNQTQKLQKTEVTGTTTLRFWRRSLEANHQCHSSCPLIHHRDSAITENSDMPLLRQDPHLHGRREKEMNTSSEDDVRERRGGVWTGIVKAWCDSIWI